MPILARGAAVVDSSGTLVSADPGFLRGLDLPAEAPAAALRRRAEGEAGLAGFLRGEGPAEVPVRSAGGAPLTLERHPAPGGLLLLLRAPGDGERLEHAARSLGLALLAGGVAHDVAGPLNTMTLRLALLGERVEDDEGSRHLAALRAQIQRVDRVVTRFREVTAPQAVVGGFDLGALAAEVLALFTHDLHQRSVQVKVEAVGGAVRTCVPSERTALLVVGLITQAVAATPDAGALEVEVSSPDGGAALAVTHTIGASRLDLGYYSEVAAAAAATSE